MVFVGHSHEFELPEDNETQKVRFYKTDSQPIGWAIGHPQFGIDGNNQKSNPLPAPLPSGATEISRTEAEEVIEFLEKQLEEQESERNKALAEKIEAKAKKRENLEKAVKDSPTLEEAKKAILDLQSFDAGVDSSGQVQPEKKA